MRRTSGLTSPADADRLVEPDPTLDALVPQRSAMRPLAVAVVLVAVLALIWQSPRVLRPTVEPYTPGGAAGSSTTSIDTPNPAVLSTATFTAHGWPSVEVIDVAPVIGADVAGAWLLPLSARDPMGDDAPRDTSSALAWAESIFGRDVLARHALPQRVNDGEPFELVVLWDVSYCPALRSPFDAGFDHTTTILIAAIDGFDRSVPVEILLPDRNTIADLGEC